MESLNNKRVTVAGLGRFGGGIAVAKWLVAQGASVVVTDKERADKLAASVEQLSGLPIEFVLGTHRERDFVETDLVVASPAIAPTNPFLLAAESAKVPVTTEICLFVERCPTRMTVGVTGTKGKSTTTALLGRMLQAACAPGRHESWNDLERRAARRDPNKHPAPAIVGDIAAARAVFIGGNIGTSLLDQLDRITPSDIVVLELSSYMLYHLGKRRWSPHVALITMIETDHLDWHGSAEAYLEAKQNIVRFQTEKDFAVVSTVSPGSRVFGKLTRGKAVEYGRRANLPEAFAPHLPGKHNRINERGAFAAAKLFGVYADEAAEQVRDFRGLPHRLELVHESAGVRWVNDSIATIPEAAVAANAAFAEGHVLQIVGGYDKGADMSDLARTLAKRCKLVLTIGKVGPAIASLVRASGGAVLECETLERAVAEARTRAIENDVVLLSTACASYDQFQNFEHRGNEFARLARGTLRA
jgi:UDP-N-acetylmuramoylalanine--D-glutamate ligase